MAIFVKALLAETGAEILKAVRAPEFIIPTVCLPVAFYTLFAVAIAANGRNAPYLLATFGVFAVMGPAIFGFGAGVAHERGLGWLDLKRVCPVPGAVYVCAKLIMTLVCASLALILVYVIAGFVAGVQFPRATWLSLFGVHLLATLPFCMLGLLIGLTMNANAAMACANIVFLALAAIGGLWMPVMVFPEFLQALAHGLPSFHLAQVALAVAGVQPDEGLGRNLFYIVVASVVLTALVGLAWRRQR